MWTNDLVQFARLIAELEAAGILKNEKLSALATSMGLRPSDVRELTGRAVRLWEEAQQHANSAAGIDEVMGLSMLRSAADEGREITTRVFTFDVLSEQAKEHAVDVIIEKLAGNWWDSADNDDIQAAMVYALAEQFGAPEWDTTGPGDFPGIANVTVTGWTLDRSQGLAVSGVLDRDNAPALPWVDGIDQVELTGYRQDSTRVEVIEREAECTCPPIVLKPHDDACPTLASSPVTADQRDAIEQAVRDALSDAWKAGEQEHDWKIGKEYAHDVAANHEFTEDGELYV